jgi:hypothetical protein
MWYGDVPAKDSGVYFVEFDIDDEFIPIETVRVSNQIYSVSDGSPTSGEYSVSLTAKIVHHWAQYGLYELDLCEGSIAVTEKFDLHVEDWVQVVMPSLLLWPYDL